PGVDRDFVPQRSLPGPVRLGAIDVGSNAIRFLALELEAGGESRVLDGGRAPVRLGHDAFGGGTLSGEAIEAAARAICDYRRRLEALEVVEHRAVATSAVREST